VTSRDLNWPIPPDLQHEIDETPRTALLAYLEGARRDSTYSTLHNTFRYSQADRRWLVVLGLVLSKLHSRAWIYREGRRRAWVLETVYCNAPEPCLGNAEERTAFVRGYFDAEGGIPRDKTGRFYIQFVQKTQRTYRWFGLACRRRVFMRSHAQSKPRC
jgi:hypothetical protein